MARVTSGLCARMEWVMERRWWVVGETAGDVGEEGDDPNAPEGEPEEAMPGEEDEEDERVAWAAAEAAEGAADADDAWEDEYQREMTTMVGGLKEIFLRPRTRAPRIPT